MEFQIDDGWPLVPPGEYSLSFKDYRTRVMFGCAPKLELRFAIQDPGEHFGLLVPRWYNVIRLTGKARKSGSFKIGKRSNFMLDYIHLFPDRRAKRTDRMSMQPFLQSIILAEIETVTMNSDQRSIPEPLQYSKVAKLLEVTGP